MCGRETDTRGAEKHSQWDSETDTIGTEIHTQGAEKQKQREMINRYRG